MTCEELGEARFRHLSFGFCLGLFLLLGHLTARHLLYHFVEQVLVRRADDLALLMTEPRRHEVTSLRDLGARGLLLNFLVSQLLLQGEITLLLQPLHYEAVFDFDVVELRAH